MSIPTAAIAVKHLSPDEYLQELAGAADRAEVRNNVVRVTCTERGKELFREVYLVSSFITRGHVVKLVVSCGDFYPTTVDQGRVLNIAEELHQRISAAIAAHGLEELGGQFE